jgi:hypothetical protein
MMTMARYHLRLPVPEIFAWHPSSDNAVGAPYVFLEFVDGIEPWQRWFTLTFKSQLTMLDELAKYHATFARPLLFKGMGSIFFATDLPDSANLADISTYRLGRMSHGHPFTPNREVSESSLPPIHTSTLREFWQRQWQHEYDHITQTHGVGREIVIADDREGQTVGAFLDVAEHLKTLIWNSSLPNQLELYEPCLAMTDYAFRNIKIDPETSRVISFLDWDDVYVFPFLLCSRFPEDICFFDGSGEPWHKTGAFSFAPLDEEPHDLDDFNFEAPMDGPQSIEQQDDPSAEQSDDGSSEEPTRDDDPSSETESDQTCSEGSTTESPEVHPPSFPDEIDEVESDRKRRIRDTLLRREYAQLLAQHDPRYGLEGFFTLRTEPMKIQYLVMNGWKSWLQKDEWLKERAEEIRRQSIVDV